MQLTYAQTEYISKQYNKFLDNKLSLEKFNSNLQKYFSVSYDFKPIIKQCYELNKGSSDIGWALYDL